LWEHLKVVPFPSVPIFSLLIISPPRGEGLENPQVNRRARKRASARLDRNMYSHQLPLSLWERAKGEGPLGEGMTTAWMQEVEQRMERLPRAWFRIAFCSSMTYTVALKANLHKI
jgi:hypothetical protein